MGSMFGSTGSTYGGMKMRPALALLVDVIVDQQLRERRRLGDERDEEGPA